jgi:hypothetical protein
MLNLLTLESLFGRDKSVTMFKFFDTHQLMATFLAQFLIYTVNTEFLIVMMILAFSNAIGLIVIGRQKSH